MRKWIIGLITLALLGVGITSAYADGDGSCSISGGTVLIHVNEDPYEGSVSYISIASPVRLDDSTAADKTRVRLYWEDNGTELYVGPYYAFSSPVDGDGYWNYRINVYWNSYNEAELRVGFVHMNIEKYGSTSECWDDISI
jgi:hypothetical protein